MYIRYKSIATRILGGALGADLGNLPSDSRHGRRAETRADRDTLAVFRFGFQSRDWRCKKSGRSLLLIGAQSAALPIYSDMTDDVVIRGNGVLFDARRGSNARDA